MDEWEWHCPSQICAALFKMKINFCRNISDVLVTLADSNISTLWQQSVRPSSQPVCLPPQCVTNQSSSLVNAEDLYSKRENKNKYRHYLLTLSNSICSRLSVVMKASPESPSYLRVSLIGCMSNNRLSKGQT